MAANRQETVSSLLNQAIRLLSNDTNQEQENSEPSSQSYSQRVADNFRYAMPFWLLPFSVMPFCVMPFCVLPLCVMPLCAMPFCVMPLCVLPFSVCLFLRDTYMIVAFLVFLPLTVVSFFTNFNSVYIRFDSALFRGS